MEPVTEPASEVIYPYIANAIKTNNLGILLETSTRLKYILTTNDSFCSHHQALSNEGSTCTTRQELSMLENAIATIREPKISH